jgi:hypothetical protein
MNVLISFPLEAGQSFLSRLHAGQALLPDVLEVMSFGASVRLLSTVVDGTTVTVEATS